MLLDAATANKIVLPGFVPFFLKLARQFQTSWNLPKSVTCSPKLASTVFVHCANFQRINEHVMRALSIDRFICRRRRRGVIALHQFVRPPSPVRGEDEKLAFVRARSRWPR